MNRARAIGFEVTLIYIGTEDVDINLSRIRQRVLVGGHDVPEIDVRRRYKRSFENLLLAVQRADYSLLFDNSRIRLPTCRGPLGVVNSVVRAVTQWAAALRDNLSAG